ncbi:MAG: GatB/YqeY domain-containing protein [Betaproteobacteria bacterium]|nr:MAG: GatB/YqeY domain-containing protein [Betaproteobacteria bacterium]TMH06868.1 MAG: GatB/YqeY domain-containing protein [Betaproteobacteria bacterium]
MSLKSRIVEDMKAAMRAREPAKLSTIRMLLAGIKQKEVDERVELSDADVVVVIDKMIKQRRESIAQFEAGARLDLAAAEKAEIDVLRGYMPRPLTPEEIDALITAAVEETGASGVSAMGKVMALLKARLSGRADMGEVSTKVKARLSG